MLLRRSDLSQNFVDHAEELGAQQTRPHVGGVDLRLLEQGVIVLCLTKVLISDHSQHRDAPEPPQPRSMALDAQRQPLDALKL